jgi:hypothetical protein
MKLFRKIFLFLVAFSFSFEMFAQVTDSVYYERIYYTCKVWGHAKYYHSKIAAGEVNWDDVLLDALPGIKSASNTQSFNDTLLIMLQKAGETVAGTGTLPEVPDSLNNNTDLSWIDHPIFSNEVSAQLNTIMQRFRPRPNVYVSSQMGQHFDKDNRYYSEVQYPDEGKRILALFRYWNIIHYFFFFLHIMDQDWDTTLLQTIPEIIKAENALDYHLAMREFTAKIDDTHAYFFSSIFSNWQGNYCAPFLARYIEGKVVVTKVLSSVSTVSSGDIIKKIDDCDIDHLIDSLRKYSWGSNEICIIRNLIDIILNGEAGPFSVTLMNNTGEHTVNLSRGNYYSILSQDNTPHWREVVLNGCKFGIVHMGNLTNNHFPQIIDKFRTVDAIIFDIRNYPNGTLWSFADYLFDNPIHIANFTNPDANYPGTFFWEEVSIGQENPNPPRKRVILLFDERTQSQAEYTCMGLEQIPGTIKIGSTTAAADGNVSMIYLPGQIRTYATFLGTYYPDYTPTQRIGIIPDYEVRPTIAGIREGKDELLEFALNCKWVKINEIDNKNQIILYPNPTTGEVMISSGDLQVRSVEVFDIFGRKLSSYTFHSSFLTSINISHLSTGIYFVKISTEIGEVVRKVLKE